MGWCAAASGKPSIQVPRLHDLTTPIYLLFFTSLHLNSKETSLLYDLVIISREATMDPLNQAIVVLLVTLNSKCFTVNSCNVPSHSTKEVTLFVHQNIQLDVINSCADGSELNSKIFKLYEITLSQLPERW